MRALFLGQPRTRAEHVQALDGLRGLAVLIVIASHLSNAGWLPQPGMSGTGKSGVYLFFVLSAYLLAHAMLARPLAGMADPAYWIDYALRRVLRIWPLYLVILLLSFGLTSLGVSGWHYQMDGAAFWRHLVLREGQDVLWSIPVEFTFYLWLPFICLALVALRGLPGGRWWGLGLLTCLLMLSRWRWPAAEAPVNSVQLGYYMPVFLAGVGAAWVGHAWPLWRQQMRVWRVTGWLLLAALAVATPAIWTAVLRTAYAPDLNHRWFTAFGLGWALLLLSVLWGGGVLSRFFASSPMRLVGVVSFSAYLWHMPVLQLADALGLRAHGVIGLLGVLGAMLAVAIVSFLLFERPWRDVRYLRSERRNA
ncbi:acyltransferase family protein [Thermomonas fusca]